jgi:hypothetical protein
VSRLANALGISELEEEIEEEKEGDDL